MASQLSERVVEDILCCDRSVLAELISADPRSLTLVARQKALKSGKLDLLYLQDDRLMLIELKIGPFAPEVIQQVNQYALDLEELQAQRRLISAKVTKVVLAATARPSDYEQCKPHSVRLIVYSPESVLCRYYENFRRPAYFLQLQSSDYGVVRLGLLNYTLKLVSEGKNVKQICEAEGRSEKTIKNRLSLGVLLGLIAKFRSEYFLTDFGTSVIESRNGHVDDRFSDEQLDQLASFVEANPFYSSITYALLSLVESVFVLAKNTYPVPWKVAKDYFVSSVGKGSTWQTPRARETATYIFANYACELEFLAKVDNHLYITPRGIRAIVLLQLNRSLKLIESGADNRDALSRSVRVEDRQKSSRTREFR